MATRRLPLLPLVAATALAVAAATGVFLLLGGSDGGSSGANPSSDGSTIELSEAEELPGSTEEVVLAALDDEADRQLGDYLGRKPIVLNFFASWCQPCLREMPAFEAEHQRLGDRVTFLGLAFQDRADEALTMVDRTGVTYPTFADPAGSALTYFGGIAMPTTVFIDASGEVTDVVSEELTEGELRDKVDALLGGGG